MKTQKLHNKLKSYSVLAGSLLAANAAHAQINYHNINPDAVLGGTIPNDFPLIEDYNLDLNNDGIYDYRFHLQVSGPTPYSSYSHRLYVKGLQSANGAFNEVLLTYTGSSSAHVIQPLNGGIEIDSSSTFANKAYVSYVINSQGAGIGFSEAYMALRFHLDNNQYMGWIRLSKGKPTLPDTPTLIIKDFAYNPVSNEPILSGQRMENSCPDPLEPLWYQNNFTPVIQLNTAYSALISPEGDIDKLKFTVQASAPNIRIVLSNLPKNYNLRLLNSSSAAIASSHHGGVVNDTIIANNLTSGTYYAEVRGGKNKFQPDKCYSIIAQSSATPFRQAANVSTAEKLLNVFPNPADDLVTLTANNAAIKQVKVFDLTGTMVLSRDVMNCKPGESLQIDISSLNEGTYLLQTESENTLGVTKFVVQR